MKSVPLPDAMPVCLLPVVPQGSGNEAINLGWVITDALFNGYDNCSITQGHSQALTNCKARFSGELNTTHLSLDTDDKSFFRLCLNPEVGGSQFLFIPEITSALLTEMQILGDCLLKQPYTPQFCQIEASEERAENLSTFLILLGVSGGIVALLGACFLTLKCKEWKHQRSYDRYNSLEQPARDNSVSFFSRICGGNNETNHRNQSADNNNSVQAGMLARGFHRVVVAVRSLTKPDVPSANIDNEKSSDAKSHNANVNTPLL